MYAIKLDRDEILIEEILVEQILKALPKSFNYEFHPASLKRGKVIAVNGHSNVYLQTIANDLWLFITPLSTSGLAIQDSKRAFSRLADQFNKITLELEHSA